MATKPICQLTIGVLLIICFQVSCSDSDGTCTGVACNDAITVKLLPTDNFLPGQYSVELVFSDNESITANFELINEDENDNASNLTLQVIENESYSTSWYMFDEFEDSLEVHYSGSLPSGDFYIDYEFTEEVTVNVKRDGILLLSEQISPNYNYYWCNYEYGKCDSRQNKDAEIELLID